MEIKNISELLSFAREELYPVYRRFITSETTSNVVLSDLQTSILKHYVQFLSNIYGDRILNSKIMSAIDINNFIDVFEIMEKHLYSLGKPDQFSKNDFILQV